MDESRSARAEQQRDGAEEHRPLADAPCLAVLPGEVAEVDGIDLRALARCLGSAAIGTGTHFHRVQVSDGGLAASRAAAPLTSWVAADAAPSPARGAALGAGSRPQLGDSSALELSELLAAIDVLRSSLAALEMRTTLALDAALRIPDRDQPVQQPSTSESAASSPADRRTQQELSLAGRISPARASHRLREAGRLVHDMPRTFHALARGTITVEAARAVARRTGVLSPADRAQADALLVSRLPDLEAAGTRRWDREITALAHHIDPLGARDRHFRASAERHVTITPGAHGMAHLHASLHALDAAAIRRRLSLAAEAARAAGDPRRHAQLMVDELVDTQLGRTPQFEPVAIEVGVLISQRALLCPADGEPATIEGYGAVSPTIIRSEIDRRMRDMARRGMRLSRAHPEPGDAVPILSGGSPPPIPERDDPASRDPESSGTDSCGSASGRASSRSAGSDGTGTDTAEAIQDVAMTLRRFFTHPRTGELLAMDSRARAFPAGLARFIRLRDTSCRGPFCNASIRHTDHILRAADGGATSADNGQGLCAMCNFAKELSGSVERVPAAESRAAVDGTRGRIGSMESGPSGTSHRVRWTSATGRIVTTSAPCAASTIDRVDSIESIESIDRTLSDPSRAVPSAPSEADGPADEGVMLTRMAASVVRLLHRPTSMTPGEQRFRCDVTRGTARRLPLSG